MNLLISHLLARYRSGALEPAALPMDVAAAADSVPNDTAWILRLNAVAIDAQLIALAERFAGSGRDWRTFPLYGIPFAIKDNTDYAGQPTTAACPEFAYTPKVSAATVQRLIDAGAILIGKTNLDQFATGLNGTRSPYGAVPNSFDPAYVSGGSSSGSASAAGSTSPSIFSSGAITGRTRCSTP